MAQYVPNFAKSPAELLIALVNNDNNFTHTVDEYTVQNLTVLDVPSEKGGDTMVELDLLNVPSEVEGDFYPFYYKRMPLSEVFSEVTTAELNKFRQVDVELDETGYPVDVAAFRAEILRKYGFLVTEADYDITLVSGGAGVGALKISAKASNVAYTGEFLMGVEDSLAARVFVTDLQGFSNDSIEEPAPEEPIV